MSKVAATTPSNRQAVQLHHIRVRYQAQGPLILNIEELAFDPGERVAIIGPSGAGKSTLLRLLNGYTRPEEGRIFLLGQAIDAQTARQRAIRRQIGFVFQEFNLVERATVFDNVLWGRLGRVNPFLSLLGWFSEADKHAAMRAIQEVDLAAQARQRADTLSGGQKQRVAVARVLAQEAQIILADEPVSSLDPTLADDILSLLTAVSQRRGVTLLMSVHQPHLARRYADRIIGLREGQIVYDEAAANLDPAALQIIYGRDSAKGQSSKIELRTQQEQAIWPA